MIIWMQHPEHGKHPAQPHEVEDMRKAGWSEVPPKLKAVSNMEPLARPKLSVPKKG